MKTDIGLTENDGCLTHACLLFLKLAADGETESAVCSEERNDTSYIENILSDSLLFL